MLIVDIYDKLQSAIEWLNGQETVAYDVETTGLNVRKDTIIGFGVSSGVDGCYFPVYSFANGNLLRVGLDDNLLKTVLELLKSKKLLCWNASFDLRFTKNNLGVDLLPALHADVMLMKHTVDEEMPFGLKEVGVKIYGQEVIQEQEDLKASIKSNGGTAKQYFKADTRVLAKYCVQDCLLTYRLFTHYSRELKRQGLEQFYYNDEVLPLYKEVTIPLEEAGIQLDMELLRQTQSEVTKDLRDLQEEIQLSIAPHLGLFTTWFLNKDYPLQTHTGKTPLWKTIYLTQQDAWLSENPDTHMFNLQSKHHLKKLFFDTLSEKPLSKTPTGQPQVNEEFLDKMALKYDWAKKLIEFNRLSKIKSTYIDRLLEEHEDGVYYPSFMQHRTVSGRYGSDVQQLPRPVAQEQVIKGEVSELVSRYTNLVRAFITPRPDNKLISADYAQLEPRTFCHVSGDEVLRDIFVSGQDFYTTIGCRVLGLKELTKKQRQDAKAYALGIPYGMTGYKLQFEIGCTQKEADVLVANYLNAFPKLQSWMHSTKCFARDNPSVSSQLGRIRHLPQIPELFNQYGRAIENDLELWKKYHDFPAVYAQAKKDRKVYKNCMNNAMNFQIQSMAASVMNRAAIAVNRMLKANNLKARLILNIHDELVYDCPKNEINKVSEIVQNCMEQTTKLSVPLIAKPIIGDNFAQCK